MPKIITLIVFFSINFVYDSFGQDYGWKIGVSGGPTLRNLHVTNRVLWPEGWDNRDGEEFSLLGWDGGVTVEMSINDRWSISSGAFFSKKGYETNPIRSYSWTNELIAETSVLYHFEFIEVPLLLQYYFYKSPKLKLFAKGGASAAWLLSDHRTINIQWGQPTEPQIEELHESWDPSNFYYRDFNIGIWLGVGVIKPITKHIEMSLEPQFKTFIKDVNDPEEWEFAKIDEERRYLYSLGLNLSIAYKFVKINGQR